MPVAAVTEKRRAVDAREQPMTCPVCGLTVRDGVRFCTGCGGALAPEHSSAPVATLDTPPEPSPERGATLGPVDRVSFFAEQRRHRRATWRLSAICALATLITGIPLSLVFTPVIFALILIGTRLVGLVITVPESVWHAYDTVAFSLARAAARLDDTRTAPVSARDVIVGVALWLVPGILAMLLIWPVVRALFRKAGVGGALLALGAREPAAGDFEERQLVNVVEEMALAAGLPPPRVRLIDSPVANAAAIGSSRHDATVVVSRGLLDTLDRDETQGALGHLIASIGNGDLRVAMTIISVYQTFGVTSAIIKAPISGQARRTLWHILRFAVRRGPPEQRAVEAERLTRALLSGGWDSDGDDLDRLQAGMARLKARRNWALPLLWFVPIGGIALFMASELRFIEHGLAVAIAVGGAALAVLIVLTNLRFLAESAVKLVLGGIMMVQLPYYLAAMMPQFLLMILTMLVLGPMMALAWRTRRYLADASAVQLTRNPDSVAGALVALTRRGGIIPGTRWAGPMFLVGREARSYRGIFVDDPEQRRVMEEVAREMAELRQRNPGKGVRELAAEMRLASRMSGENRAALLAAYAAANEGAGSDSGTEESLGGGAGSFVAFHPSLERRLRRLKAQGATIEPPARRGPRLAGLTRARGAMLLIAVPLMALLVVLFAIVIVLLTGLSLLFCGMLMMAVYALFTLLR
jgi:Zn-dependent protease with chaperone function